MDDKLRTSSTASLISNSEGLSSPVKKHRHPKFIELQKLNSRIGDFGMLKYYLQIILMTVVIRFFYDLYTIFADSNSSYFDLALRIIQIMGYGYGLQAFQSKKYFEGLILRYYFISTFAIILYYIYISYASQGAKFSFFFDIANFLVNIFVLTLILKFLKLLLERDQVDIEIQQAKWRGEII